MSVFANLTETDDFLLFTIFTTSPGDHTDRGFYPLPESPYAHVMLLADGKLAIREDDGPIYVVEAPGVIEVKPGVSYWFQNIEHGTSPLQPNVLYCVHNKNTPGWDGQITTLIDALRRKNEIEQAEP